MLINKKFNKAFLLICFIFVMLPALLILGNKTNTENLIKLEDVSENFDVYDTQCFNKKDVINSIESSYTDIRFSLASNSKLQLLFIGLYNLTSTILLDLEELFKFISNR